MDYPKDETDLTAEQMDEIMADAEFVELVGPAEIGVWRATTFAERVEDVEGELTTSNPTADRVRVA